jgi:hypothetical protein
MDRKAAVAAYRQRKPERGIYAVRCEAAALVWVGRAPDLATIGNRIFFSLRHGGSPHPGLQAVWNEHGAESLAFEVLEVLDSEEIGLGWQRELKRRHADWIVRLGAAAI